MAANGRAKLHGAWRRRRCVALCLLIVITSFCFIISPPHRPRIPLPTKPGAFHQPVGIAKGFLVHSPGCSIPDLDPLHQTIRGFIFKPKPIICKKPAAFTSSRGNTLYLHCDILRQNFPAIQNIYEDRLSATTPLTIAPACPTPTTTTTHSPSTTTGPRSTTTGSLITTASHTPPTTLSKTAEASSPPSKRRKRGVEEKIAVEDVRCCYKGIYRVEQKREEADSSADGKWRYNDTCKALNVNATEVEEDAVLVVCSIGTVVVYKNIHYFFHRKKFPSSSRVITSLSSNVQSTSHPSESPGTLSPSSNPSTIGNTQSSRTTGSKLPSNVIHSAGTSSTRQPTPHDAASTQTPAAPTSTARNQRIQDIEKLNVIIMGTDSASRLNMLRHLPKTYEYLTEELGALDLKGYNKVGDNTYPNIVAILGGYTEEEVDKCMTKTRHYDDCNWIWKDFKSSHYVTTYMEDAPDIGCFHYLRKGFIAKPTDYYGRQFMQASLKEIGNNFCVGNQLSIKVVQDYALEYARAFLDTHFFGFFWSSRLTHDDLNLLNLADESYLQYLQEMKKMGALNNTALFFLSDHGIRFGDIRSTYIGMLEERLPYVVLYLPPWFRKKYHLAYDNLVDNTHRLTSNFDVHETLLDLAYGRFADRARVTSQPSWTTRGTSFFRTIPWNRTCVEANIPAHFCTCQETIEMTEEEPDLLLAASHVMDVLNEQLQPYPQCEQFAKVKVMSARMTIPNKVVTPRARKSEVKTYVLQASLTPGAVIVEASVRHTKHDNSFEVKGEVSRINKYGSTSACVKDDLLRKYCYCKDQAKAKLLFNHHAEEQKGSEVAKISGF